MTIDRFRGEYFFLSNMAPFRNHIVTPEGVSVQTVEQLYQSAKLVRALAREAVQRARNGFAAQQIARRLIAQGEIVRTDWDSVKVPVMRAAVMAKFTVNPELADQLIATGEEELIEGNTWGDTFWGVSPPPPVGHGENMLGTILMETRTALQTLDRAAEIDQLIHRVFPPLPVQPE